MSIAKPLFWNYAVFNEDGELSGIAENSPKEVVESYAQYLKECEEAEKEGVKL